MVPLAKRELYENISKYGYSGKFVVYIFKNRDCMVCGVIKFLVASV